jgi:hypothetical protein
MVRSFSLIVMLGGIILCSLLLSGLGRGEHSPSLSLQESLHCPPLPDTGLASQVSVYVAKALDLSGVVCVRVVNGFSDGIHTGPPFVRLQKWEEGRWWRKGKFRNFVGQGGGVLPYGTVLPAGGLIDERLPGFGEQAPPGKYRVCFSYLPLGQKREQEVCSKELLLP